MPDGSAWTNGNSTFNALTREHTFRHPPKEGSTHNILNEFVAPHIESFNALFDDSGLPAGDSDGKGILSLALKDIGERIVFDGNGGENLESGTSGWGNRMRSEFLLVLSNVFMYYSHV
jgi:DNA-directed RNA polymerase I subunit RPA2